MQIPSKDTPRNDTSTVHKQRVNSPGLHRLPRELASKDSQQRHLCEKRLGIIEEYTTFLIHSSLVWLAVLVYQFFVYECPLTISGLSVDVSFQVTEQRRLRINEGLHTIFNTVAFLACNLLVKFCFSEHKKSL